MLESEPEQPFLLFALAKEYDAVDEVDLAIEYFEKLLEIDSEYIGGYYHLAELLNRQGEVRRAQSYVDVGIEVARGLGDEKNLAELCQLKESF